MNKIGVVVGVVIGLTALSVGGYVWQKRSNTMSDQVTPVSEGIESNTPSTIPVSKVAVKKWDDPAGFSFEYPQDLTLNTHPEDGQNYAHLEFTNPGHPGSVVVWAKDLPRLDMTAVSWLKAQKEFTDATTVETTMGERTGVKAMISTPKKLLSVIVDDGIVYYAEADLADAQYWTTVHTTITGSFVFTYGMKSTGSSKPAAAMEDEDVAVDEEEVVE